MKTIKSENFRDLVKGKFFTVSFIKKDGSERILTGRLGVKKYVKGTGKGHNVPDLITVFENRLKTYRSFYLDKVNWVHCCGVTIDAHKKESNK